MEVETMEALTPQLPSASAGKKLMQIEESVTKDIGSSSSAAGSTPESLTSDNNNSPNSDGDAVMSDGDGDVISDDDDDDDFDYDYIFDTGDDDDDDYLNMQVQFDNTDLPPGIEAPVSWLKDCTPTPSVPNSSGVTYQLCYESSASNSSVGQSSTGNGKEENGDGSDAIRKYQNFKHFDVVNDFSDHHYNDKGLKGQQLTRPWSKKIQDEWKILEKDLPDTIFVRVYETRMDLLRAVIVGPQGTPYHDGLFVFDAFFPSTYPDTPPSVYYYSGGLRLNPNLYNCGKVCLSLLNTWSGHASERWQPNRSTMLQVLVSIQALILNAKPFFNEPGYESSYLGAEGERRSKAYNENVFVLTLKTMMYTLRRPPRHFEDLVASHFHIYAHDILKACKAYREGAIVGSPDHETLEGNGSSSGTPEGNNGNPENGGKRDFKAALTKITNALVSAFTKYGVKDCERFRLPA